MRDSLSWDNNNPAAKAAGVTDIDARQNLVWQGMITPPP